MSSKEHGKKNPGHFYRGKPGNRGRGSHPPTPSKQETKDDQKTPGNLKTQNQPGNKGKKNANKQHQSGDPQQSLDLQKGPMHNLTSFLSGISTGGQSTQINQSANFTQISVNVQTSSFTPHIQHNRPSFVESTHHIQSRGNARRGHSQRAPNIGQPSRFPSKESEAPTQIRIFSGSRESNSPKPSNFRMPFQNPRGGIFHQQIHGGTQVRPLKTFHSSQNNKFILPTPPAGFNQYPQQSSNSSSQYRIPVCNKQVSHKPNFFKTNPTENSSNFQIYPKNNNNKGGVARSRNTKPFEVRHVPAVTPVYKFTKNTKFKKAASQSNLSSDKQQKFQNKKEKQTFQNKPEKQTFQNQTEKQTFQNKPEKQTFQNKAEQQGNVNQRKTRQRRPNLWKKKKTSNEATPLFSFQRLSSNTEADDKESVVSDTESTSVSHCSSDESVWTTNISDDEVDDSFSDESEVTSEMSLGSSVKGSEVSVDLDSKSSYISKVDGTVSVFWDIENCPVPSKKSAVDFVKHVRTTFYEGRTEGAFTIVCDVTNLSPILSDELAASNATLIHMSNTNKNAADTKISSLLFEFPDGKIGTHPAIVLISGDSDFSKVLNTLNYKYHVYINLICKANAKHSLVAAAHNCIFYEEFVKDLPARARSDCIEYLITVSSFPRTLTQKKVKASISSRLKGVNCRVRTPDATSVAVIFPDQCARDRALLLLKDFALDGTVIETACSERETTITSEPSQKVKPKKEIELKKKSDQLNQANMKSSEGIENDASNKAATLCVCVSNRLGDSKYWKNEFVKLWSSSDFTLQWEGDSNEGIFLVNFKSLNKAQKAKKILQKAQKSDPTCPKFVKLIKQDGILTNFNIESNIQDLNRRKIEDHIHIIESKKEVCLKKHKETIAELNSLPTSAVPGSAEAKVAKFNELNEHKVTFLNFTQKTIDKVQKLDLESETIDESLVLILRDYSRECNCLSTGLPIYAKKNFILKKIKKHQVVIIRAETGSGKSTQLTQYIWREDFSQKSLIICTQPRKIAAITLAKHVSSQIGCGLGEIVGYQVGMTSKKSSNTAILYVTDFTMLKMIVSNDLKDVSCIIIDEAHERTVYTDLLLGMIKSCLKMRPDLKLIITSATIDTSIFKIYLGLTDDSILEVSGRTFPVEDVWLDHNVALGWDYFNKTIDTVYSILNQAPGDVLVFLTTPFETEKAVNVFSEKLNKKMSQCIKVYQLHGKLDMQEQQKIFEHTPNGARKIVFATNCAETSITIPGIRYVVDCGMVKESQYDAIRNMNVLSVNFVSQSSAEQRRGRAGRTQVGMCYRLYSKGNYEGMIKNSEPEILRVNLGQALLRLMKIGVKDPLQFDFVQSPPKESLVSTMKQLTNLKAVNEADMSLSELGKRMSCLPLEPRLSYLVLTGIDRNVGFEAVVLSALVTVSRNIFFRSAENKSEADVKKMRFCQSESDFLTYFEVYKEWAAVPRQTKSKWCTLNCINARSLRTAHDLVNELIQILEKEVNIKVASKFNDESVHDTLLQLVFQSFYQNLCIFSGYHRFGYRSVDVSGDLLIHPSSSLYTYGHWRPDFLVYDTILQTNQTYLINVSPVTKDAILDCMSIYGLKIDLQALEFLRLTAYGISPVGKTILFHDIIGKQGVQKRLLESQLKTTIGSSQVAVEVDVQKGEVKVHAPQSKYDEIAAILCPIIEKAQERLSSEEKEVFIYPELCAVISTGLQIRDVVLPGEFKDIKVTINTEIDISSVVEKLQTCGPVCTVREWKNYFKVTFLSPVHAKVAIEEFKNETSFSVQKMIKANVLDGRINQYKVLVSFLRRECTGEAFVSIDPPSSLHVFASVLNTQFISYRGNRLQFSMSKKSGDLRIGGLPPDTDRQEFEKLIKSYTSGDIKFSNIVIVRKKVYESTPAEAEIHKQNLLRMFSEFTPLARLSVDLKRPSSKDYTWNAFVFFQNACDGETAISILKNKIHVLFNCLQMKPSLQTSLYCKLEVYWAVQKQVEEALNYFKDNSVAGNTLEIKGLPKEGGNVQIQIFSNNVADISDARKSILSFLLGDQIECAGIPILEKLFSNAGREYLKKISNDNSNCYIDLNAHKKVITIFGDVTTCSSVKLEINKFLDQLAEEHFEEIHLMPETGKPGVLRELLSKYGHDLQGLKDTCGFEEIEVNSRQHILTVKGSSSSVSKCQDIIKDLKLKLEGIVYEEDTETCPVCFVQVSEQLHRLEYCGHAYCKECILHWFQSTNDFPLNCISCDSSVVLADIQWAAKEVKSFEMEVFKKSLASFVASRNDVSYCPSPDCPMIFRVSTEENSFECPSCNNSICTRCKELYHYGMSCSLYQCCKGDEDYSLKEWIEADPDGRKICPSCSAPIEKNGGCNHMTCWKCKCHMCWLCLQVFPTPDCVYNHQPYCPKPHKAS